jgi:NADH-quinone oxidoreductase subunit F
VQNVETLSLVPAAVNDPEGYAKSESTLVSLWGHVRRPGVYRVPLGTPLSRLIETEGEGAPDGVGMIFPAGPSGAPLGPDRQDTPLDPDALRSQGSALGTAAVLVTGRSSCPLSVATSLAGFFERESCGQCPPCTLGTMNLARVLRGVESGEARARDLQYLEEAAGFMAGHGYCAHGRTAAASVTGLLARFSREVRAHLDSHGCPTPEVQARPFDSNSPERAAIEAVLESLP